ncbi:MAG: zinc-dependent peptidase [Gammaproteobacteria bacterium]|jgi:MtfA peptidase
MLGKIRAWRDRRIIQQSLVSDSEWRRAFWQLPLLQRLSGAERERLTSLAILLLHRKQFSGAHDLVVDRHMQLVIALQACLPILNLDIGWYRNWHTIILYPEGFTAESTMIDESGITHKVRRALSGEAWERGPVILSWMDSQHAAGIDGENLVIHEFVHKLDMLNGAANGFPPLHREMSRATWTRVFSEAFDDFQDRLFDGDTGGIDPYAGHSPAEFLAVLSEVFFERPELVRDLYPEVYGQMVQFFRQDPMG